MRNPRHLGDAHIDANLTTDAASPPRRWLRAPTDPGTPTAGAVSGRRRSAVARAMSGSALGVAVAVLAVGAPGAAAATVSPGAASAAVVAGSSTPGKATAATVSGTFSGSLTQAVDAVAAANEQSTGYDRDLFPHWSDADGDCRSARHEVLIDEAEPDTPLTFTTTAQCTVATGRWFSYYDRVSWTAASDVDIDHLVPLSEAWGSGAGRWSTTRREEYANDLGDRRTLVGVTDNVNQAKGDQDPATWLPAYDRCRYLAEWVAVKIRWGLTADAAERSALEGGAASCSSTTVTVERV
jgi:hypothetical protein